MMQNRIFKLTMAAVAVTALASCSSREQHVEPVKRGADAAPGGVHLPTVRATESPSKILSDYQMYQSVLDAIKLDNDVLPSQFLSRADNSAMAENVRNEWLKSLGKRGQWAQFQQQFAKLDKAGRAQEVSCYAEYNELMQGKRSELAKKIAGELGRQATGCTLLVEESARRGQLDTQTVWRRVRGLISNNQITDARNLTAALGSPLDGFEGQGAQEKLLVNVISPSALKNGSAASRLSGLDGMLTREQSGFAWGVLGYAEAKKQNFSTALNYYNRADKKQLSDDQFEWYARSALRFSRWSDLANIIESMPEHLKKKPDWQYWLARSLAAQGNSGRAKSLYTQAAQSGRNFYAVMSMEELGQRVSTKNNVSEASKKDVKKLAQDGAIDRALNLFQASQTSGDWKMRRQAQAEWRFAIRGFNEDTLLAAAQLAFDKGFYEMAVNTADSTNQKLNYTLRYISPFKDITVRYANQVGIDPAWVYGLIRQESRFMLGAQSSVGAQGLMQVMPATAREIAGKIGMDSSQLYTMDGNIRMGTWYMADAKRRLQNNEVMATAGYNAGPARARNWQAATPLEGAIYAETIPFNETRDYVKKVMTNATYYATMFNEPQTSLKQRMGTVPGR
ncbi:lytic transglycosylase domain-containing protein [Neisseria sp. 83E34]|uniref:lytic transglycosylase domain-containing protein n=1 Tax=Neisseria sp. 83E34 TaxID=1692264 RepID=UPI0006CE82BF|nr:lytic transglycosylase domain-containing protein [Neisseria sp. 83E34]KPN70728.1 lytic murein transglycosylase [Neisseria sp. 83E34]